MDHVHGGNTEQIQQKYNIDKRLIDFSANINFLGPPAAVKEKLNKNMQMIDRYPEQQALTLKKQLAEKLKINSDRIIAGNGAVEIIYQLLGVLQPDFSLIPAPFFSEYIYAVRSINKDIKRIYLQEENNFQLNIEKYIAYLQDVNMAFLCNPHNPTGILLTRDELLRILKAAFKADVWLVVDEAFIDFVDKESDYSLINSIKKYDNLFIIRSLTKFFAIPGLRLGYGLGPASVIEEMETGRDPWSVNIMAQEAGKVAVEDKKYIMKTRKEHTPERNYLYTQLQTIKGLKPFKPAANFIFIKITAQMSAGKLKRNMAKEGILIRDCSSYKGLDDKYIRVAVKSREDNNKLLTAFNKVLNEKGARQ